MKKFEYDTLKQSAANCGKHSIAERRECTNNQRPSESDGLLMSCAGCNGKGDSPWCCYCPKESKPRL